MLAPLRRWLRIGIGGMMVAVLVFGLWLGYRVNRAKALRAAVTTVKADGGFVLFADQFAMGPVNVPKGNAIWKPSWGTFTPGKGPWAPEWLRSAVGDEFFREAAHVSLFVDIEKGSAGAPNNLAYPVDDVLLTLRKESGIKTLHLGGPTVTDKGLETVGELTDLRELVIWWATAISDKGVANFSRLPRLKSVDISLSKLGDESVEHLASLPALEELHLEGKKFTDQSLVYLSRSKRLTTLILRTDESEITDAGLEHLKGLTNLKRLHLEKAKISTEARDKFLKAMPNLEFMP